MSITKAWVKSNESICIRTKRSDVGKISKLVGFYFLFPVQKVSTKANDKKSAIKKKKNL